jgi:3-deoxy-manno-octulosonate cytidylyltransferase (CMP-KDO synthetase)
VKILGIIPARYSSTRFPGKPLADINGKTMIMRVYEQAKKATTLSDVIVATDDASIFDHVKEFGGNVRMTSSAHQSGTSRCLEVVGQLKDNEPDVVVNIQGDEPFIDPSQIDDLAMLFANAEIQIATLIKKLTTEADLLNPNIVKVVATTDGKALYFSRSPIPYFRESEQQTRFDRTVFFKHIGIYAYRSEVLKRIVNLPAGNLESAEALEQLRWLENGYNIHVAETNLESHAVDTPDDLSKFINN